LVGFVLAPYILYIVDEMLIKDDKIEQTLDLEQINQDICSPKKKTLVNGSGRVRFESDHIIYFIFNPTRLNLSQKILIHIQPDGS
jgi:hypothetical protein